MIQGSNKADLMVSASQWDGEILSKDHPLEESCTGQKQSALVPLLSSVVS